MRYYCARTGTLRVTQSIGEAMDRAPRPYTASEIAQITGLPIGSVQAFLVRNLQKGAVSMHFIPRRGASCGKPQREYWRGRDTISYTFGRGSMITEEQARELEAGRRPIQWRETASTVYSIDETDTLAVRRGEQVIVMGQVQQVRANKGKMAVRIKDGPRLEFSTKPKRTQSR